MHRDRSTTGLDWTGLDSGWRWGVRREWGHLQGVERAQALEGIWGDLGDLVVAQVSAVEEKEKEKDAG